MSKNVGLSESRTPAAGLYVKFLTTFLQDATRLLGTACVSVVSVSQVGLRAGLYWEVLKFGHLQSVS